MYIDGYKYWLVYRKQPMAYYRCSRFREKCLARCTVANGAVHHFNPHNHPREDSRFLIDRFRKVLTQRATTEKTELYKIYMEEASSRHAEAAQLYHFSRAESCMRKARVKEDSLRPPKSLRELEPVLDRNNAFRVEYDNRDDSFYQTCWTLDDTECVLFWHLPTVKMVAVGETLRVTCGRRIENPFPFYLLTIQVIQAQRATSVIFSLLSSRNYGAFHAIFEYVKQHLAAFLSPSVIFAEFDAALRNALVASFPTASVQGCWQSYQELLREKAADLGMAPQVSFGNECKAFKMLLVLPFLEANHMAAGVTALQIWMEDKEMLSDAFKSLLSFVQCSLVECYGAEYLSLHDCYEQIHWKGNASSLCQVDGKKTILDVVATLVTFVIEQLKALKKQSKRAAAGTPIKKEDKLLLNALRKAYSQWTESPGDRKDPLHFLQQSSACVKDSMTVIDSIPGVQKDTANADGTSDNVPVDPPPLVFFSGSLACSKSEMDLPPPLAPFSPVVDRFTTNG